MHKHASYVLMHLMKLLYHTYMLHFLSQLSIQFNTYVSFNLNFQFNVSVNVSVIVSVKVSVYVCENSCEISVSQRYLAMFLSANLTSVLKLL
jgi:hypothetical protein